MGAGGQSQNREERACPLHATILLRLKKNPQQRKCYRDEGDQCVGGNPAMFFKIENQSSDSQSAHDLVPVTRRVTEAKRITGDA